MEDFKILTEEELAALTSSQRRDYLKKKKEYDNKALVHGTLAESNDDPAPVHKVVSERKQAGRKPIPPDQKKQQIHLTVEASTKRALEEFAKRDYARLLSRYIDNNLETIMDAMKRIY